MTGTVGILNVGAGDTRLVFDPDNPQDMIRAARIVKDMLRRGYALLIDAGQRDKDGRPIMARALDFDETKCEYIIADFDPLAAQKSNGEEDRNEPATEAQGGTRDAENTKPRAEPRVDGRRARKRIKAESVNAVGVARTAGG